MRGLRDILGKPFAHRVRVVLVLADRLAGAGAAPAGSVFAQVIPGGDGARVPAEATEFTLPAGSTVRYHGLEGHYEGEHERKPIADVQAGEWAAPPLTARLPGGAGYAAITEA